MERIRISLRILPIISLMLILASCGSDGASESTGSARFNLEWKNAAKESLLVQTSGVDICNEFGIGTINARVFDDANSKVSKYWSWSCSDHQGTLTGIPIGSFRIGIEGVVNGTVVWEGSKAVVVEAWKEVDIGTVTLAYTGSDTTSPYVSSVSPVNGATIVPVTTSITVKFSEKMAASTINSSSIVLKNGTTIIPCSVSYNQSTTTATLTPATALQHSATYKIVVMNFSTDTAGNYLKWNNSSSDGTYSYTFVTN